MKFAHNPSNFFEPGYVASSVVIEYLFNITLGRLIFIIDIISRFEKLGLEEVEGWSKREILKGSGF